MDSKIKAKWVEALRSGTYKQTGECLRNNGDYFCCLGVLADVCGKTWQYDAGENQYGYMREDGKLQLGILEDLLLDEVGMTDEEQEILWDMNDIDRKTFAEIADYIEENL